MFYTLLHRKNIEIAEFNLLRIQEPLISLVMNKIYKIWKKKIKKETEKKFDQESFDRHRNSRSINLCCKSYNWQ